MTDWVGGLKLDSERYREVVEDARDLVRRRLYDEGVVERNLKMRSEMQQCQGCAGEGKAEIEQCRICSEVS